MLIDFDEGLLANILKGLQILGNDLTHNLLIQKNHLALNHKQLREQIFTFSASKQATTVTKIAISNTIRKIIQEFIKNGLAKYSTDNFNMQAQQFIKALSAFWQSFQLFVFAFDFVTYKLKMFFESLQKQHNNRQMYSIPSMACKQLNNSFHLKNIFTKKSIFYAFKKNFCFLLATIRQRKVIEIEGFEESFECFESCFYNQEADIIIGNNGLAHLYRRPIHLTSGKKTLTGTNAAQFFCDHFLEVMLRDSEAYYISYVQNHLLKLTLSEDVFSCLQILAIQNKIAATFIKNNETRFQYLKHICQCLISYKVEARLKRQKNFFHLLEQFQQQKTESVKQLKNTWTIFSRSVQAIQLMKIIFQNYMRNQNSKIQQKLIDFKEFIEMTISLNKKSSAIVQILDCNTSIEFDNIKLNQIRLVFNNRCKEVPQNLNRHEIGAEYLAYYLNNACRKTNSRNDINSFEAYYNNIFSLFKIITQKSSFINKHQTLTIARLLQDIDFSKQDFQIKMQKQKKIIKGIQEEYGFTQVLNLGKCLKDIEMSFNRTLQFLQQMNGQTCLGQIIIKNPLFPQDQISFQLRTPISLLSSQQIIQKYFLQKENIKIVFELGNGVSFFQGRFGEQKILFQLKNIYMMILLLIDEQPNKKIMYSNLFEKIKPLNMNSQKNLKKYLLQLFYSKLILSPAKAFDFDDKNFCNFQPTDLIEMNKSYKFAGQQKKQRPGMKTEGKKYFRMAQLILPKTAKNKFDNFLSAFSYPKKEYQQKMNMITNHAIVKILKHSHVHNSTHTFQQIFQQLQTTKCSQFHLTRKYVKEQIQGLIATSYCERLSSDPSRLVYKS